MKVKGGPTTRIRLNAKTILGYTSEDDDPPNYLDVMSYDQSDKAKLYQKSRKLYEKPSDRRHQATKTTLTMP